MLELLASIFFILSLHCLSSPKTALVGNYLGMAGMGLSILITCLSPMVDGIIMTLIALALGSAVGIFIAQNLDMRSLPQLVAAFHSLIGFSAVLVAFSVYLAPAIFAVLSEHGIKISTLIETILGLSIGALTASASVVAFAKLQGIDIPLSKLFNHIRPRVLNATLFALLIIFIVLFCFNHHIIFMVVVTLISLMLGLTLVIPIGGADMPVVVSLLNSYSGWAAAGIGFSLNNKILLITGALVGSSGAILSYIMCKAMNRSIINVLFTSSLEGITKGPVNKAEVIKNYNTGNAQDAAFLLENAQKVIIVPGYGMAVAQAHYMLKEMHNLLSAKGISVKYAIHPVAGRMPGHMNILLAEANIDYEHILELSDINQDFVNTDVVYVIGANDITNPLALEPNNAISGMEVLKVWDSARILFVKRSMGAGYANLDNPIFYRDKTLMLFGDAKLVTEEIVKALKGISH